MLDVNFTAARWINPPQRFELSERAVTITTDPHTDFWQRSYYGFKNDNAPALLFDVADNFTLIVKASFRYQALFDQCGLIIYLDSDNWFKASIEYQNEQFSRLGSVVTNRGYSDWATADIAVPSSMWYRLSRRGPDFLIESATDGANFEQMRIFHLYALGETTAEMGRLDPPAPPPQSLSVGVYACSPSDSSFTASFDHAELKNCQWAAHRDA